MSENVEKQDGQNGSKLNRRNFIGALGAAAAAGALLETMGGGVKAQNPQTVWYQDSFGDIVPAGSGTLALGITPPPLPPGAVIPGQQNGQPQTSQRQPPGHEGPHAPGGRLRAENVEGYPHGPGRTHPESAPTCAATYYSSTFPQYNILMIMVDQMRNPYFWPPQSGSIVSPTGPISNISKLMNTSFVYPNFFVSATVCSPSRASFLTGLYSQQHCVFEVLNPGTAAGGLTAPPLLPYNPNYPSSGYPGFPTIGNVLSQVLPSSWVCDGQGHLTYASYDCTWIGKWHVSCGTALGRPHDGPGYNGPSDYGFSDPYCIPVKSGTKYPAAAYPSPDGLNNEATAGDFLDSNTAGVGSMRDTVEFCDTSSTFTGQPTYVQLNDAAIAWAFTNGWLQYAASNFNKGGGVGTGQPLVAPWFCAVSFVNPHDITEFPYSYGLAGTPGGPCNIGPNQPFCPPSTMYAPGPGFQLPVTNGPSNPTMYYGNACLMNEGNMSTGCSPNPPATGGPACAMIGDSISIPNLPTPYSSSLPTGPNGWNFENLSQMQYGSTPTNMSKPGLQAYFQNEWNLKAGLIADPGTGTGQTNTGWEMFLNYYLWMQSCVDQQVGNILYGPSGLIHSPFWGNTIIIFTSDHGDYAGSHGLHAKGGALYEEVINVPLVISMPEQRASGQSAPIFLPYVCSSVDILPFIYSMALGNEAWRGNTGDMVYYLSNRESIADAIMQYNGTPTCNTQLVRQRRISAIPLGNPPGGTYNWQMYQPYVLHTADDYAAAYVSPFDHYEMPQPSHAIAFRTADPTALTSSTGCPSSEPTPANGATLYQGGKLGIYSYWNTCDPATLNAPIMPINLNYGQPSNTPPNSQYEFYNYSSSQPNVLETGNDYFTSGGAVTPAGQNYYNAFTASSVQDVQHELYYLNAGGAPSGSPTQQVQAAIQDAYNNYILWLTCMGYITGSNGQILNFGIYACPDEPNTQTVCPTCASDTTCSPGSYKGQN